MSYEAILPDTEPGAEDWVEHNRKYAEEWPNITRMIEHSADASSFEGVADKFKKYFRKNRAKVIELANAYF